ncbi:MAG: hypothetical protein JKY48_07095 [Flavobacteriales bacterium]|nr:hypothetical protein [Flavobacteriales bacterium]
MNNRMIRSGLVTVILFFAFVYYGQARNSPLPCLNKRFSIVAHLVKDTLGNTNITEADINSAIDSLNIQFAPICVSFEVCEFRTVDNYQYDDLRFDNQSDELAIKNRLKSRINMFFTQDFTNEDICGRATLGGIASSGNVFIDKDCTVPGDFTIAHEMGHFFGLKHTFEEPSTQLVDGTDCETTGDGICDTPADPYVNGITISAYIDMPECRFISPDKDANGDFYDPHVGNIMSYYPCACEFTDGQYKKMAETYLSSNPKNW